MQKSIVTEEVIKIDKSDICEEAETKAKEGVDHQQMKEGITLHFDLEILSNEITVEASKNADHLNDDQLNNGGGPDKNKDEDSTKCKINRKAKELMNSTINNKDTNEVEDNIKKVIEKQIDYKQIEESVTFEASKLADLHENKDDVTVLSQQKGERPKRISTIPRRRQGTNKSISNFNFFRYLGIFNQEEEEQLRRIKPRKSNTRTDQKEESTKEASCLQIIGYSEYGGQKNVTEEYHPL